MASASIQRGFIILIVTLVVEILDNVSPSGISAFCMSIFGVSDVEQAGLFLNLMDEVLREVRVGDHLGKEAFEYYCCCSKYLHSKMSLMCRINVVVAAAMFVLAAFATTATICGCRWAVDHKRVEEGQLLVVLPSGAISGVLHLLLLLAILVTQLLPAIV